VQGRYATDWREVLDSRIKKQLGLSWHINLLSCNALREAPDENLSVPLSKLNLLSSWYMET
jgi:hypothetical protein